MKLHKSQRLIRRRVARRQQKELELLAAAIDRLTYGLLLLNERGEIIHLNRFADEVLRSNNGLRVSRQRLIANKAAEMARLGGLVAACTKESERVGALQVYRGEGRPVLHVIVASLRKEHLLTQSVRPAEILVLISDPARSPSMPRDIMIQLFGLTPAEARLALFIGAGGTVEEAAHRFHTALSTARSQMRQVLTKTDTHRQADLVRLISRLDFFQ